MSSLGITSTHIFRDYCNHKDCKTAYHADKLNLPLLVGYNIIIIITVIHENFNVNKISSHAKWNLESDMNENIVSHMNISKTKLS